eukprot:Rmarinus@m.17210
MDQNEEPFFMILDPGASESEENLLYAYPLRSHVNLFHKLKGLCVALSGITEITTGQKARTVVLEQASREHGQRKIVRAGFRSIEGYVVTALLPARIPECHLHGLVNGILETLIFLYGSVRASLSNRDERWNSHATGANVVTPMPDTGGCSPEPPSRTPRDETPFPQSPEVKTDDNLVAAASPDLHVRSTVKKSHTSVDVGLTARIFPAIDRVVLYYLSLYFPDAGSPDLSLIVPEAFPYFLPSLESRVPIMEELFDVESSARLPAESLRTNARICIAAGTCLFFRGVVLETHLSSAMTRRVYHACSLLGHTKHTPGIPEFVDSFHVYSCESHSASEGSSGDTDSPESRTCVDELVCIVVGYGGACVCLLLDQWKHPTGELDPYYVSELRSCLHRLFSLNVFETVSTEMAEQMDNLLTTSVHSNSSGPLSPEADALGGRATLSSTSGRVLDILVVDSLVGAAVRFRPSDSRNGRSSPQFARADPGQGARADLLSTITHACGVMRGIFRRWGLRGSHDIVVNGVLPDVDLEADRNVLSSSQAAAACHFYDNPVQPELESTGPLAHSKLVGAANPLSFRRKVSSVETLKDIQGGLEISLKCDVGRPDAVESLWIVGRKTERGEFFVCFEDSEPSPSQAAVGMVFRLLFSLAI